MTPTPERILQLAVEVKHAATGTKPGAGPRTPPHTAFRDGPAGRRAWLAHAERNLPPDEDNPE